MTSVRLAILLVSVLFTFNGIGQEEIFFFDDFNNNKNNWNVTSNDFNNREIKNGYYYFSSKKENTTWWQTNPNIPPIDKNRDFYIEWSFIQIQGSEDWGSGLICFFDSKGENTYGLWTLSNGHWVVTQGAKSLQDWTVDDIIAKNNNALNTGRITKKDQTISFSINGKQVHSMQYNNQTIQHVAFQIGSIKTIAIDYLKIAYLPEDRSGPEIELLQPAVTRGLKVVETGSSLVIKGIAKDESGVQSITINGVQARLEEKGNFNANLPLGKGDNTINIVAIDKKNNIGQYRFYVAREEEPVIPVVNPVNEVSSKGKYYALVIGVQDYADDAITDLDQPVADATSLFNVLSSKYTFQGEDVKLLKNPTRKQIFQALESLAKKVKSQDNLVIFYAGHGYWDEQRKQGYWFPSDAQRNDRSSWLTNADLKEYISAIQSKHTLLITDACFAGSIFKSRSIMSTATTDIKQLYELPSRKAMTSGTLKEVPDKSVFIEYLVKRLQQNNARFLSAAQLFASFRAAVINNSANGQVPQYGEIKEAGDEGGDFIFIKK